jgi:hypothetical protein
MKKQQQHRDQRLFSFNIRNDKCEKQRSIHSPIHIVVCIALAEISPVHVDELSLRTDLVHIQGEY